MKYDPIKHRLGVFFNGSPFLRKTFYRLLDLLLLRAWYVHYELKKWARNAPAKVHILDAGAGFGQYTYYLSGMNADWNVLAVDVKEEQVSDCNRFFHKIGRESVLFRTADLTQLREKAAFDLIVCVDVMEHIEDDNAVFRNFHQSLREGGMLLISTPSDKGGSGVKDGGDDSFIEEHVRNGYGMDEIQAKLKAAGFSRVRVRYSYGVPGQLSWKLSMKYPILLIGLGRVFYVALPFYYLLAWPLAWLLNVMDVNSVHRSGTGLIVKAYR